MPSAMTTDPAPASPVQAAPEATVVKSPMKSPAKPTEVTGTRSRSPSPAARSPVALAAAANGSPKAAPAQASPKQSPKATPASPAKQDNAEEDSKPASKKSASGSKKSATGSKKSRPKAAQLVKKESYAEGEIVFAHVKGFPHWPARVVRDDQIAARFHKERHNPREICVAFYGTYEIGFVTPENLVSFKENLAHFRDINKGKSLNKAMDEAESDPDTIMSKLEAQRKSDGRDMLDDEEMDEPEPKKAAKKSRASSSGARKRKADDDEAEPRASKRSKKSAEPTAASGSRKSARGAAAAPAPAASAPVSSTKDRMMKWRHILQKTFIKDKAAGDLPRVNPPTLASVEWDAVDAALKDLAAYLEGDDIDAEALTEVKIGKVLRLIGSSTYPAESEAKLAEHKIRETVQTLSDKITQRLTAPAPMDTAE